MKNSDNIKVVGPSSTSLLQIAFIVLKLCKVIDWKWRWVLAPTWINLIIVAIVVIIAIFVTRDSY